MGKLTVWPSSTTAGDNGRYWQ